MGNWFARHYESIVYPEITPEAYGPSKFDPKLGFGNRKERVMIAKREELIAAKIPESEWDFCAHLLLDLERCRSDNLPFLTRCRAKSQALTECYREDWILRLKEFERERRLLIRQKRLQEAAAA